MSGQSFIKFYGADWRSDPKVRLCSPAARGVWIDAISLMMEAEPYGYLPMSEADFAALTNTPLKIVRTAWEELDRRGVWSRDDNGTPYSRRMLRDREKMEEAKAFGKQGGNPKLRGGVNPPDNGGDKLARESQKPDTRSQKPEAKESRGRASRLPPDWALPDDWRLEAQEKRRKHNLTDIDLDLEAEKFRNYWHGVSFSKGAKVDWKATWMNWALRADAPRGGLNGARPDRDELTNPFALARQRRLAGERDSGPGGDEL